MATKAWQHGPRGGRYYITSSGEKKYGAEALEAARQDARVVKLQSLGGRVAAGEGARRETLSKLVEAKRDAPPALKEPKDYLIDSGYTSGGIPIRRVEPIRRGPGPVIKSSEAEAFSKGSKFPQAFVRGTDHPDTGVFIPETSKTLSLFGRGIYMTQIEDAEHTKKYGTQQNLRVNVKNPINYYGEEGKAIKNSPEYKALKDHFKNSDLRWDAADAAAFQAVAQSRGHDATYYDVYEKKPKGGERPTGRVVLIVWDAAKVAVVKD